MLKFEQLDVYQKGMELIHGIYKLTRKFPAEEKFGITEQIKRAAVSIVLNIAEGNGRFHKNNYIQFLRMARSSAYEVVALLQIAQQENIKLAIPINRLL